MRARIKVPKSAGNLFNIQQGQETMMEGTGGGLTWMGGNDNQQQRWKRHVLPEQRCPHLRTKTFGGIGSSHVDVAGIAAVNVFEILITERGGVQ
jgi:hypothetical protein